MYIIKLFYNLIVVHFTFEILCLAKQKKECNYIKNHLLKYKIINHNPGYKKLFEYTPDELETVKNYINLKVITLDKNLNEDGSTPKDTRTQE